MKFDLEKSYEILERTPAILRSWLTGLSDEWLMSNEGPDTFSPYDIIGHLIHAEVTDWTDRTKMILEHGTSETFVLFDRFAMYELSKGKTAMQLLDEFEVLRTKNMKWLHSLKVGKQDLDKRGIHPKFGEVTLRELLSTTVVHDLAHLAQIGRVMAKQYKEEVGPWIQVFRILNF
jgi:hypothetical protein